jgi:hypothetical protein
MANEDLSAFEQFVDNLGVGEDVAQVVDETALITLRSTVSGNFSVATEEPLTIEQVLEKGELTVAPNIEYMVDGVSVPADHVVAPGATVTAIGMLKGG